MVERMEEIDFSNLPKKERKRLKREMEREEKKKGEKRGTIIKWTIISLLLLLSLLGGWFLFKELSKPLPGQAVEDQGRDHVSQQEWEKFSYNSNPPTSGPHDLQPAKPGVYDTPQGDGYLVHSLEHGYIVISYNCETISKVKSQKSNLHLNISNLARTAFAHETEEPHEEPATGSGEASPSSSLSDAWETRECQDLKKQLSALANEKKLWKIIVVPRPNLDARIALTAWTKIDKMETFDKERIVKFIDAFRNKGPEQTME